MSGNLGLEKKQQDVPGPASSALSTPPPPHHKLTSPDLSVALPEPSLFRPHPYPLPCVALTHQ